MSLQLAAKHLADKGRGPDSTLVHMSMDEVKSLQDLAKAHGGAITINPDTGLPEAGFLSSILPMVAGAALMATGVGAPMAALMVGGGMTAATGSLQKGIMAGLSAYGGAGLGAGLMGAGGAAAMPAGAGAGALDVLGQPLTGTAQAAGQGFGANISQMGQGLSNLTTEAGRAGFMGGVGGTKGLMQAGMAALAPMMASMGQQAQAPAVKPTTPMPPMQFNPGRVGPTPAPDVPGYGNQGQNFGREQRYFNPSFSPVAAAPVPAPAVAPTMAAPVTQMPSMFAGGGTVEQMSDANAVGANTGYPMANIPRSAYATPYQQPMSQNVVTGPQDTAVDPFTGAERMAGGGITELADGGYLYDPKTQTYSGSPPVYGSNSGLSGFLKSFGMGSNSDPVPVAYKYDPITQTYTRIDTPATSVAVAKPITYGLDSGGFGGDISVGGETLGDFGHGYGAGAGVGAIGFGQGLSGMGMTGVGGAIADAGIATLGAMEAQAAADAAAQGYGGYGGGGHGGAGGDVGGGSGVGGAEGGYGGGEGGGGYARGGLSHLGDYSDGGRLLRGPGDGVSDSIPAMIGRKQPARLADGEFVVPARIVSELGNGSTEAGARKLYAMMDRVQRARGKTTGKGKIAKNTRADKYLPA